MVKRIAGFIICREFWNHEPSWALVVDDVRVERHEEHVIWSPTDRAGRPLLTRSPTSGCTGRGVGQSITAGVAKGLGHTFWVFTICGFPPSPLVPGIWGPSLTRIAFDSWDFLSLLLFYETRVESKLSSCCEWQTRGDLCSGCIPCSAWRKSTFPGYVASSFLLELAHWLLSCGLWGGADEDTWMRNTSFSSLSLLVSWSKACTYLSL